MRPVREHGGVLDAESVAKGDGGTSEIAGSTRLLQGDAMRIGKRYRFQVCEILDSLAEFNALDEDHSGNLTRDQFLVAVHRRLGLQDDEEIPEETLQEVWRATDSDGSGTIDFEEFLAWMQTVAFIDKMNGKDPAQRRIQVLSKQHRLPLQDIERIWRAWARSELAEVDKNAFQDLLRQLLAPKSRDPFDLPRERLDRFWLEAEKDRNGLVTFPSFVSWYATHFVPVEGSEEQSETSDMAAVRYYRRLGRDRITTYCEALRRKMVEFQL